MNINREVRMFRRQFKIMGTPGIAKIKQIICQMGYTLLPYAETAEKRGEHTAPAYTLDNGKYKIVYYNDLLNENDLLIVLIYEAAHIYLGHFRRHTGVYDTSVQKDFEAHQITARLLKAPCLSKRAGKRRKRPDYQFGRSVPSAELQLRTKQNKRYTPDKTRGNRCWKNPLPDVYWGRVINDIKGFELVEIIREYEIDRLVCDRLEPNTMVVVRDGALIAKEYTEESMQMFLELLDRLNPKKRWQMIS